MSITKCRVCETEFIKKRINQVYCSPKCKSKFEISNRSNKPKSKKCKFCNIEFSPYTSLDKFCSANCRINYKKSKRSKNWSDDKCEGIKGKNNPSYRNGNYCIGKSKTAIGERQFIRNSKAIRKNMIDNIGYLYCENCQTSHSIKFECHHLIYRSEKPLHKNLHDKENLILLCIKCHNEFHRNKYNRNSIVESRKLNSIFGDDVLNK